MRQYAKVMLVLFAPRFSYLSVGSLKRQKKPMPCKCGGSFPKREQAPFRSGLTCFLARWFWRSIFTIDGEDIAFANSFLSLWKRVYTLKKEDLCVIDLIPYRAFPSSCPLAWLEIIPSSNEKEEMLNFFTNIKRWNKNRRGNIFLFARFQKNIFC